MGLKVLHLIDSGGLYGAEKMLLTLVKEQLKQGLEPMILSAGEPQLGEKAVALEAKRLNLPVISWYMKPGLNIITAWKIVSWARKNQYSMLHSHGYKFDVLLGFIPAAIRRIPLVATHHGHVQGPRFSKTWIYERLDKWILSFFSGVVIVGEAVKDQFPAKLRSSERLNVIRNGVDLDETESSRINPLRADLKSFVEKHDPVLLGVGRLAVEKGFNRLIEALPVIQTSFPNAGLLIIGDGSQRSLFEEIIQREKIENVFLPGYCSDVPAIMSKSTILVIPSLTEGLPITLLEAMAVGCPVAVTNVGEMSKVLSEGQGGKILRNKSSESLGVELVEHIQNRKLTELQVEHARSSVLEQFSAWVMATEYQSLYERVLAK